LLRRQKTGPIHNQTGFSQDDIPYKNFSEFIPQHDSDPHILSLCQRTLLSVEISESGRQPESRIPRRSNESRTSYTRIPACGTPYFTDDNKESEQKTKINTRFKRYLSIFAEYRKPVAAKSSKIDFAPGFHRICTQQQT
jgi:hypothetical protein